MYIGAMLFGARAAAGNSIEDIESLAKYAHKYHARVYLALNTILYDNEIESAIGIARSAYSAGIDGIIIQDMGLVEYGLPPVPIIASTQCDNSSPEKIRFLEKCGFSRAILARELSLNEIRTIREAAPKIELETFIHGALCVSMSGRCYMSHAIGGRSANRGVCAQPCRKKYRLVNDKSDEIIREGHLLSTKDLNLSDRIPQLLDAGVTSFKIEGRLKDESYIKSVVFHYRKILDSQIELLALTRASDGIVTNPFDVDIHKVFNRGFTRYFIDGRKDPVCDFDTPKWKGEFIGTVLKRNNESFVLNTKQTLSVGDGLSFFADSELTGSTISSVKNEEIFLESKPLPQKGTEVYRNNDLQYSRTLDKWKPHRAIPVSALIMADSTCVKVEFRDSDGLIGTSSHFSDTKRNESELAENLCQKSDSDAEKRSEFESNQDEASVQTNSTAWLPAENPDAVKAQYREQILRLGNTEFFVKYFFEEYPNGVPFIPIRIINEIRRHAIRILSEKRLHQNNGSAPIQPSSDPYPLKNLSFEWNISNKYAKAFYQRHDVDKIENAVEAGTPITNRKIMTIKHCLLHHTKKCASGKESIDGYDLVDDHGKHFTVRFNCEKCIMEIFG